MDMKNCLAMLAALLFGSASLALGQTSGTEPPKPGIGGGPQQEEGMQKVTPPSSSPSSSAPDSGPGTGTSGMQDGKPKGVQEPDQTSRPKGVSDTGTVQDRSGSMRDSGYASGTEPGVSKGRTRNKGSMTRARLQRSEDVREAQQQLSNAGFDPGPVDGILGPHTQSALRKFQRDKGMKETGQLDGQTKQALMSGKARTSRDTGPMPSGSMPSTPGKQPGAPPEEKSSGGATPTPTQSVPGGSGTTGSRPGS